MTFEIFIHPKILGNIPAERREQIMEAIKGLENPLPGSSKKRIKGVTQAAYRLRVGDFRIMYDIDFDRKAVYIFDILTAEQAHKKYDRLI